MTTPKRTPSKGQGGGNKREHVSADDAMTNDTGQGSKRRHADRTLPQGALLSATDAATLLGVGRTRFWQLRKQYELQRVEWSPETRPLYRREDVLKLTSDAVPQSEGDTADVAIVENTSEAARYKAAWAEHDTEKQFEWRKGSGETPDWVKDALGEE